MDLVLEPRGPRARVPARQECGPRFVYSGAGHSQSFGHARLAFGAARRGQYQGAHCMARRLVFSETGVY